MREAGSIRINDRLKHFIKPFCGLTFQITLFELRIGPVKDVYYKLRKHI